MTEKNFGKETKKGIVTKKYKKKNRKKETDKQFLSRE